MTVSDCLDAWETVALSPAETNLRWLGLETKAASGSAGPRNTSSSTFRTTGSA